MKKKENEPKGKSTLGERMGCDGGILIKKKGEKDFKNPNKK